MTLAWTWEERRGNAADKTSATVRYTTTLRPGRQNEHPSSIEPALADTLASESTSPFVEQPIPLSTRKYAEDSILPPPMQRSSPVVWLAAFGVMCAVAAAALV